MLAAYVALMTTDTLGLNPLLAIIIVVPIMAAIVKRQNVMANVR